MQKDRIRQFLFAVGSKVPQAQNRTGFVVAPCPFAQWKHDGGIDKHPSFAVKVKEGGVSRYNCFSCNSHGDLYDMVLELKELLGKDRTGYDFETALQLIANEEDDLDLMIKDYKEPSPEYSDEIVVFPEWWLDSFEPAWKFPSAKKYLKNRGIKKKTCLALDLRYDTQRKRICFPIRDWDGYLVGLHGRTIEKDGQPRYYAYGYQEHRNRLPWIGEHSVDLDKPVVLVEGPFDYAKVYQQYKNVLCSLSVGLSKSKCRRIADAGDLVTLYDHGKGGDSARDALDKYLTSMKVHLIPTEKQGDPGNMTPEEIDEWLQEYT